MAKYWELAGECHEDFSFKKMIECYGKTAYYQQSNDNFQSAAKTYLLMANFHIEKEHMNEGMSLYQGSMLIPMWLPNGSYNRHI